jgi:hypothetical protein
MARTEAALALAAADPPAVDRADAADWLQARLAEPRQDGVARVVLHSIAYQYFPPATQGRIAVLLEEAGALATAAAPVAWLRFEMNGEHGGRPTVRLRLWPDGRDRLLAFADAHVRAVEWFG